MVILMINVLIHKGNIILLLAPVISAVTLYVYKSSAISLKKSFETSEHGHNALTLPVRLVR